MRREHIEEVIAQEVEKIIAGTPIELVDVEYVRERTGICAYSLTKQAV